MIVNNLNEIKQHKTFALIVGSGPAGITTALELEKKKIKSLIIEAGGIKQNKNDSDCNCWGRGRNPSPPRPKVYHENRGPERTLNL